MPALDLPQLDALLHRPAEVLRQTRHLGRSALSNALLSCEQISRAVDDRRRAQAVLDLGEEPGDLTALDRAACLDLLSQRSVGRLAYVARQGVPDVAPVNYALVEGDLWFRSGPGPKLQAAERGDVTAFEVDVIDEDHHGGWSVVVVGRLAVVGPGQRTPDLPDAWANGPRRHVVRLTPQRVTGRRLVGRT